MAESASVDAVDAWLDDFQRAVSIGDMKAASELFAEDSYWRDVVAFTWDIQTLEGRAAVGALLEAAAGLLHGSRWTRADGPRTTPQEGVIAFETSLGRGRGYLRLRNGRCWTLLTCLEELKGFEERTGPNRPRGHVPDPTRPTANWRDLLEAEAAEIGRQRQPFVLVVGGGQGGLALGARLRQLQVPTLIIDRLPRVGDQWRSRYRSLSLHDPVWYDHLPYLPFPEIWPVFTPKDKIGDWLESYAKALELNVWCDTECVAADHDPRTGAWAVTLRRGGETLVVRPEHLVLATGNAGKPERPVLPREAAFQGPILHSSDYRGGAPFSGQSVAVIGSNNSAHDICADLVEHGARPTMIQRSSTHVIRSETMLEVMLKGAYSEEALAAGITTDIADLMVASMPLRVAPSVYAPLHQLVASRDADFYARLEAVGFLHDFGEDGTGMPLKYLRRASGYYIDVGASELVADGTIALRAGVEVTGFTHNTVQLSDGSDVPADAVICATGFGSMDQWAAELISPEVAARVGKVWGYGSGTRGDPGPWEGELRNMWKPTRQEGLWFHGGNLAQNRFYSRALALQLKARQVGLPVEVFRGGQTQADHLAGAS